MTEYIVAHIENDRYDTLDTWANPADARNHLNTLIDVAWGEGAIVSIPCVNGALATDRAVIEVVDPAVMGVYAVRIVPVTFIETGV